MSDDGWEQIVSMLDHGWPGEFGEDAAATYRLFLDGFGAVDVAREVAKRVRRGDRFRPSGAELCGALTPDVTSGRGSSAALVTAMQRPDRDNAKIDAEIRSRRAEQEELPAERCACGLVSRGLVDGRCADCRDRSAEAQGIGR